MHSRVSPQQFWLKEYPSSETRRVESNHGIMDPGARDQRSRSPVRRAGGYSGSARPTSVVPRPPAAPSAGVATAPNRPPPRVMDILDDIVAQLRSLRDHATETQTAAEDVETRLARIEHILAAVTVAWGGARWEDA